MAIQPEPVIISRKKRKKKSATHGGAWKVAFADFTLAMMALFMVLWIMQVADQRERTLIVQYLKGDMYSSGPINPFDLSNSSSIIDLSGGMSIETSIVPTPGQGKSETAISKRHALGEQSSPSGDGVELNSILPGEFETQAQLEILARELDYIISSVNMNANVDLQIVPQGIRILVHDNVEQFMFTRGSAEIQHYFEDLLLALGELLGQINNGLSISGHTDSLPFAGSTFTNWELSSQRALLARRILEAGGVDYKQVVQVTGMADQSPYVLDDPAAAANRRIELLVLTQEAEENLRMMTGLQSRHTKANRNISGKVDEAIQAAEDNMPRMRYPN
ncbi:MULTISPECIES: flagellar motor protein MotB [Shewanella]|uniref:flagellar motor protein MotB n=1 Tax=Shewanella TaxID=22 RepID=UPI001BBEDE3C|nr:MULTISPECIES: flagellar motor protein MotB [Shewanella]GIU51141.1 chemotaxis protein LafU [Shewanella sp. KT0246]